MTPAHVAPDYRAELVLLQLAAAATSWTNAVGLLKEELRRLGSVILRAAPTPTRVAAGGALAVDRRGVCRGW